GNSSGQRCSSFDTQHYTRTDNTSSGSSSSSIDRILSGVANVKGNPLPKIGCMESEKVIHDLRVPIPVVSDASERTKPLLYNGLRAHEQARSITGACSCARSEEHTYDLVCRLLLEKNKCTQDRLKHWRCTWHRY